MLNKIALTLGAALVGSAIAQSTTSCAAPSPSGSIRPSVASGYRLQVVASGLAKPRGILLDSSGNLLVVEQGSGVVSSHVLQDRNGCVTVQSSKNVTNSLNLNHGIELSSDGRTLYASNPDSVYSWAYDVSGQTVSNQQTVITNMTTDDHTTRTLLLSRRVPGMLVVGRGSTSNLDLQAASLDSGHSQMKAYNLNNRSGQAYDFNTAGLRLGWGLRNDVGITEHPTTGGIYSVENSADQIMRDGVDVHQNNPGEEMNFFGYLNGTSYPSQGGFYGYPWCLTAWNVSELPNNGNLTVGKQFAITETSDLGNQNRTDEFCAAQVAPRLTFQAHMAPLDIKFNNSGNEAWITFHGSWDRTQPVGYKVSVVQFRNGSPVAPSNSTTAAVDIITNMDNSVCPNNCFRPVGLAIDNQGRIFMSSDASGEIYLITKVDAAAANSTISGTSTSGSGASPTSSGSAASSSSAAVSSHLRSWAAWPICGCVMAILGFVML